VECIGQWQVRRTGFLIGRCVGQTHGWGGQGSYWPIQGALGSPAECVLETGCVSDGREGRGELLLERR
jgi:hypothetical protein